MSPLSLRRFRAERLLREEFEARRGRVTAIVRLRLGAAGAHLDASDLDACYAQAFHGLYAAVVDGREIANPSGWLVLVTYRRAIEESRARRHLANAEPDGAEDRDFAAELDDRIRLRQLFEALRGGLSQRELQAAALCYLQGLSRVEAAARMGVSEARMRKLMEGHSAQRPGVAGKVGALVATIRDGGWCDEQGSLMRGLAYGVLDPDGERHRLAVMHSSECPACRAYVVSLRGLAAVLPPVPALLQWALGGGAMAETGAGAGSGIGAVGHGGLGVGGSSSAGGQGAGGALAPAGPGFAGAVSASGAAGAGAAGGGWLLAGGSVGAKLAIGCLLAIGVGAGCVALTDTRLGARTPDHRRASQAAARGAWARGEAVGGESVAVGSPAAVAPRTARAIARASLAGATASARQSSAARLASREFGPEQAPAGSSRALAASGRVASARVASASGEGSTGGASLPAQPTVAPPRSAPPSAPATPRASAARSTAVWAAQREFAPG